MAKQWSTNRDFILATAGAAIGLGNIWKFPYMVGQHGGSAFILIYLLCVALIGIPLMMAETVLGRYSKTNPVTGLTKIGKNKIPYLSAIGYWGIVGLIIVLSFYSVLAGWSIAFFIKSITGQLNTPNINNVLDNLLASPIEMTLYHSIFMFMTCFVVIKGLQAGLEKATRILMPALFLILFLLVIYACIIGSFKQAFDFLFMPNFAAITPQVIFAAMGHSFFTLALGAGAIFTYGSYAPKEISLSKAVITIAILDTLVAILAGVAIFPVVFAQQLAPTEGPTLMFLTIPKAFANIPFGQLCTSMFFLFLTIASWTSSINIAETPVLVLCDKFGWERKNACFAIGALVWILGIGSILSFNLTKEWTIYGMNFFDLMTQIPDKLILPIGGTAFSLIAGFLLNKHELKSTLPINSNKKLKIWLFLVRYFCPAAIMLVMVNAFFS